MAEVQESGPLVDHNFENDTWRSIFGSDTAIVGDTNGGSFGLTLPPASDSVEVGSATNASRAVVSGFLLEIPAATTQSLEIPASSNGVAGRTDLIVARLNPTGFTTPPGPVRLHRIAGTEGSPTRPSYSTSATGSRDLPLYAITRKLGEALTEADVVDLRWWSGPHFLVDPEGTLPLNAPLGSHATRNGTVYRRDFVESAVDWVVEARPTRRLTGTSFTSGPAFPGWSQETTQRLVVGPDGVSVWVHIEVTKSGGQIIATSTGSLGDNEDLVTLDPAWRPQVPVSGSGYVTSDAGVERNAGIRINAAGVVQVTSTQPGASVRTVTADAFYSIATA